MRGFLPLRAHEWWIYFSLAVLLCLISIFISTNNVLGEQQNALCEAGREPGGEGLTGEMASQSRGSEGDIFILGHFLVYILPECLCS